MGDDFGGFVGSGVIGSMGFCGRLSFGGGDWFRFVGVIGGGGGFGCFFFFRFFGWNSVLGFFIFDYFYLFFFGGEGGNLVVWGIGLFSSGGFGS